MPNIKNFTIIYEDVVSPLTTFSFDKLYEHVANKQLDNLCYRVVKKKIINSYPAFYSVSDKYKNNPYFSEYISDTIIKSIEACVNIYNEFIIIAQILYINKLSLCFSDVKELSKYICRKYGINYNNNNDKYMSNHPFGSILENYCNDYYLFFNKKDQKIVTTLVMKWINKNKISNMKISQFDMLLKDESKYESIFARVSRINSSYQFSNFILDYNKIIELTKNNTKTTIKGKMFLVNSETEEINNIIGELNYFPDEITKIFTQYLISKNLIINYELNNIFDNTIRIILSIKKKYCLELFLDFNILTKKLDMYLSTTSKCGRKKILLSHEIKNLLNSLFINFNYMNSIFCIHKYENTYYLYSNYDKRGVRINISIFSIQYESMKFILKKIYNILGLK